MKDTSRRLAFRPDLQGLRALAIALVVLAHAGMPGVAGGFIGVDIFFVLSGYLITGLLLRERIATGGVRFLDFIARRLKRLLPALLAMLIIAMPAAYLLLSDYEFTEQTTSVAYAASWTSNLFFAFTTFDYFAELHRRDLFLHTWSLGVEEQFYLLWPLLTVAVYTVAVRRGESGRRWRLLVAVGSLFLGSLLLSLLWSPTQTMWAYYLTPARVWQFCLGAMVFIGLELDRPANGESTFAGSERLLRLLALLGFVAIVGSAVLLHPGLVYPGYWALLPSCGAAAIIGAGCTGVRSGVVQRVLAHRALVWLGDRSYSLYLWHWPLLMLGFAWGLAGNPSATIALVLLAVFIAMASYRWIELPFWKGRFGRIDALRGIAYAGVSILFVGVTMAQLRVSAVDVHSLAAAFANAAREDMPALYSMGCDDWIFSAEVNPCVIGDPEAPRTAVLLGDSVGVHWYSLFPATFRSPGWRVVVLTKSSCAWVDEDYNYFGPEGRYQVCTDWREAVLGYLQSIRPDVVFVGSAPTYAFSDQQWVQGSRRLLERIAASAVDVVLIAGTPKLSFNGPGCLRRRYAATDGAVSSADDVCSESLDGKPAQRVLPLLARATEGLDNVGLLNLNDLVCPDGLCSARRPGGVVVFRDERHLTDTFVRAQEVAFRRRVAQLGLQNLRNLDD